MLELCIAIGLICVVAVAGFWYRHRRKPKISGKLDEFKTTLGLVEFFCERTYELYFQLQINPALLVNEPFEEHEYNKQRKDFYKMVTEQMGSELVALALYYFGHERAFVRFIASYFEDRLINARTMRSVYGSRKSQVPAMPNGLHLSTPEQQRQHIRNNKE